MMLMMPKLFYREHGLRYSDQVMNPPPFAMESFPRESLLHWVPEDVEHPDVDMSKLCFKGYSRKILVNILTEYAKEEGPVRKLPYNLPVLTKAFRRANMKTATVVNDPYLFETNGASLLVNNYGYLDVVHKYLPMQFAEYYRWLNRTRTIYAEMAKIAKASPRQQFFVYPVPRVVQGRTVLNKFAVQPLSSQLLSVFGKEGSAGYHQLDFWKWLMSDQRQNSLLSVIDPNDYPKINFVFRGATGKMALLNLGYIDSWIKKHPNRTEMATIVQYQPLVVQNLFLKLYMVLNALEFSETADGDVVVPEQAMIVAAPVKSIPTETEPSQAKLASGAVETTDLRGSNKIAESPVGSEQPIEPIEQENDELDDDGEAELEEKERGTQANSIYSDLTKRGIPVPNISFSEKGKDRPTSFAKDMLESLERDIEALDRISLTQLKNTGGTLQEPEAPDLALSVEEKIRQNLNPREILQRKIEENAEVNLITASDFRKFRDVLKDYEESEDPFGGSEPRLEAMKIKPEEVAIHDKDTLMPVGTIVPDASMQASTLKVYDRQYLDKVYHKDLLNVVDSLHAAGVLVKRHEVDVTPSILGTYERHTLELKPIDGAPSTVSFTLPRVDPDGTFMSGGVKRVMRKQRVDTVIRKISPQVISLSTYYGKTFVQTSTKVVNSSLLWLYREINKASLVQDGWIHDVTPGNVFDNDLSAPYIYGALSNEYASLWVGKSELIFNYLEREKRVNPDLLSIVEKKGRVWCGFTEKKAPIVVDPNNQFFVITQEGETPLGTIYELLKLEKQKCPIDFSEIRVFSKYIPVGVVLGYYLGFTGLVKFLKAEYRVVPARKNKMLTDDEYAVVFKDESWVFKRNNRLATLILAGFADYGKLTKEYELALFDEKDVYLNLFMSKGISAIYIRELDMMETSFIDPISKELLLAMNEPVTFTGLILRATELLLTYQHPASQDPSVMRIRGYERFAGIAYKELMQAVRQFRNQNLLGRSKINISPYQVWNTVMKDNSMKIVEETNPIQNLKESEVYTYSGIGGRDKDTMTKPTRAMHPNDYGISSESTVDSSAVGTIVYLTANPGLANVRGVSKPADKPAPTQLLSTSAMVSPAVMNDN